MFFRETIGREALLPSRPSVENFQTHKAILPLEVAYIKQSKRLTFHTGNEERAEIMQQHWQDRIINENSVALASDSTRNIVAKLFFMPRPGAIVLQKIAKESK